MEGSTEALGGVSHYTVKWEDPFPRDLKRRAIYDDLSTGVGRAYFLARIGQWASFFGFLRRSYPAAFVLTNIAFVDPMYQSMCIGLNIDVEDILPTYPYVRVDWDYGPGRGGAPIRGSPAHLLGVEDLAPLVPGLMGSVPLQVSFVLLLAPPGTALETVREAIQGAKDEDEWEDRVLGTVAILGFSVEGAVYFLKASQHSVQQFLGGLVAAGKAAFGKGR